jgi:hypothetical protein
MLGIGINDPAKKLDKLKLEVIGKDKSGKSPMTKYRTEDGNDLSFTTQNGKIVYIENDWLQDTNSTKPLLTNFEFGKTSIKEIIQVFGTRGFVHKRVANIKTETDLIEFYCFELDSPNNEILALVTKLSLSNKEVTWYNAEEHLMLEAVILADKDFLDELWGSDKLITEDNKKVKL